MAQRAIYKCKKCGNEFESNEGMGHMFQLLRCVKCDNIKSIPVKVDNWPSEDEIGVCEKCGGELRSDLRPMCPVCKSREAEEKKILMEYE